MGNMENTLYDKIDIIDIPCFKICDLVGGVPTPLKIGKSIGMMTFPTCGILINVPNH